MLVKPRDNPTHLLQVEALSRRLTPNHRHKKLVDNLARNLRTGYNGEKSLDFTLGFLPKDQFHILHNLRIKDEHGYFQMDTLIISPYFILIIEVKNIYGTILFDDMGQAIRIQDDGTEEGFNNPIHQINLQGFRLRQWLRRNKMPLVPLEKIIIYSNISTILKNVTNNKVISNMVIHKEGLLSKLEEFAELHEITSLTTPQIEQLSARLIAAHTPKDTNIMKRYDVSRGELLRGVICPDCSDIPMFYSVGKWKCRGCGIVSRTAYLSALEDYQLLISNTIKN